LYNLERNQHFHDTYESGSKNYPFMKPKEQGKQAGKRGPKEGGA
jgi:hypothetical protein